MLITATRSCAAQYADVRYGTSRRPVAGNVYRIQTTSGSSSEVPSIGSVAVE